MLKYPLISLRTRLLKSNFQGKVDSIRYNYPVYDRLRPKPCTLTTYGNFFRPKDTFALIDSYNHRFSNSSELQFDIEVYNPLSFLGNQKDLSVPLNPAITARKITIWQQKHPYTRVARVHDAFSYNWHDALYRLIKGEPWSKKPSHLIGTMLWGVAKQGDSIRLVNELKDQGSALSMHGNIAIGYQREGFLPGIIQRVPKLLLEVEKHVGTPYGDEHNNSIIDPAKLAERVIQPLGKTDKVGIILALDHMLEQKISTLDEMQKDLTQPRVLQFTEGIHISGPNHGLFSLVNPGYMELLKMIVHFDFVRFVQFTLDSSAKAYSGMSFAAQLDYLEKFARAVDESKN